MDRVNIRYVAPADLPYRPDFVVIDTSFISLKLVLPVVLTLVALPAEVVALVKPQFEAGRELVGKGGIVRDASGHRLACDRVTTALAAAGFRSAIMDSPLLGTKGNREFLVHARRI